MTEKRDSFWYGVFIFTLLLFLLIAFVGPSIAIATQENDSQLISSISDELETSGESGSYAIMAYIYSVTNEVTRRVIVIIVGTLYLWQYYKNIREHNALLIAFFAIISPIFMYLSIFQKDITSTIVVTLSYMILIKDDMRFARLLVVMLLYLFYGYTFREYYMLIAGTFVVLKIFKKLSPKIRLPLIILLLFILALAPQAILTHLQEPRDLANEFRVGTDEPGTRTAFMNLLKPDGFDTLIPNYFYAFFKLNIGIIFTPRVQEYFLLINLIIYMIVVAKGIKNTPRSIQDLVILFVAHILVINLFEPDLGSYLRHASTPLLFLAPVLALSDRWDRRNPDRSRLRASLNSRIYRPQAETLQGRQ